MVWTRKEKYAEIAHKMRSIPLESHGPSHEWEEVVKKMCASDDTGLQQIGKKEHNVLNQNK